MSVVSGEKARLFIPINIQDDVEEARRKRRRHTLTYVEEHSDAADKFLHHKN
jgi:hypothetical protein